LPGGKTCHSRIYRCAFLIGNSNVPRVALYRSANTEFE
jgi:hypothetical protein